MEKISRREQILGAFRAFIAQRPGLEFGNYGDVSAYRSEMRSITKDRHTAEFLLAAVSWRESIGEKELRDACRAFSGRLSIVDRPNGGVAIDYCTGQYFPTEYRRAVCAVMASALWSYVRDGCMPSEGDSKREVISIIDGREYRETEYMNAKGKWVSAGTWIREYFVREFGRNVARVWFD
jgi:hypothetical protein